VAYSEQLANRINKVFQKKNAKIEGKKFMGGTVFS
jgi:hypothetical protein